MSKSLGSNQTSPVWLFSYVEENLLYLFLLIM